MEPAIHPDIQPLAFLLGTWAGEGEGGYPTSSSFRYREETTFSHMGEPWITYTQKTWSLDDGVLLHMEHGFVRPGPEGGVELVFTYPLGIVEVAEGTVSGTSIEVASTDIRRSSTGDPAVELRRRIDVRGDSLSYELMMATEETPHTRHSAATLTRA